MSEVGTRGHSRYQARLKRAFFCVEGLSLEMELSKKVLSMPKAHPEQCNGP